MADMRGFGSMALDDRGGTHPFSYSDERNVVPSAGLTPSQTVGPFFAYGLTPGLYGYDFAEVHNADLAGPDVEGTRIVVEGRVLDGADMPVHDALIELVQADAHGSYITAARNDGFTGYGRFGTGAHGPKGDSRFLFRTVRPGATLAGAAPFLVLIVSMRGLLNHFITRAYFPEDDHGSDPVMAQVPEDRRETLVARAIGPNHYQFDIHMQGSRETVFFDL